MRKAGLKYRKFRRNIPSAIVRSETFRIYDLKVAARLKAVK